MFRDHRHLHAFPTRRSADLGRGIGRGGRPVIHPRDVLVPSRRLPSALPSALLALLTLESRAAAAPLLGQLGGASELS